MGTSGAKSGLASTRDTQCGTRTARDARSTDGECDGELMKKLKASTVYARRVKIECDKQRDISRLSELTVGIQTEYRDKMRALRARCSHKNETHYRDAAGGFGSFHQCDDCGQEAKKSFKETVANVK